MVVKVNPMADESLICFLPTPFLRGGQVSSEMPEASLGGCGKMGVDTGGPRVQHGCLSFMTQSTYIPLKVPCQKLG